MKKVKISLLALGLLVAAAPTSQAAFVKAAVTVTATSATTVSLETTAAGTFEAANITAATKVKASKKGFFEKLFNAAHRAASGSKSQTVAALLAFFLGGLGIHRFYLGYTWQGVVQLLTAGGFGIWALVDFVRILLGTLQPKDGSYE